MNLSQTRNFLIPSVNGARTLCTDDTKPISPPLSAVSDNYACSRQTNSLSL